MAAKHHLIFPLFVIIFVHTLYGDATPISPQLGLKKRSCREDVEMKEANCDYRGFDSVPQNLPENIAVLYLKENRIKSLLNSSFERYPLLTGLHLYNNDIRVIESSAFYPLKELEYLDMAFNSHLVLPATGLFMWARKLTVFDLKASNLISLPNDTLKWSPIVDRVLLYNNQFTFINISYCGQAKFVDLSDNKFKHLTLEAFNFACQSDILDLTENPIQSVDPTVIASLNVKTLRVGSLSQPLTLDVLRNIFIGISRSKIKQFRLFYGPRLKVLPADFFDPLRGVDLAMLDFSGNSIRALYPSVFSNLTRTKTLNISSNSIEAIEPDFFEGMQELRVLNLNKNQIKSINLNNRSWTIDLLELHLSRNYLTKISQLTFLGLQNITFLDLYSNQFLSVLEQEAFAGFKRIHTIKLSRCNLANINMLATPSLKYLYLDNLSHFPPIMLIAGESFKNLTSLVHLNLRKSGLAFFNLWDPLQNISLFDGLVRLTFLDLGQNSIDIYHGRAIDLPPGLFTPLSALQNLSLEECQISSLHPLVFERLKSLQKLNLRGNKIKQLPAEIFKDLVQVTYIDLQDNRLAHLDKDMFINNRRLTTLLLSNNKLLSFNRSTFELIGPSLSSVDLSNNPIECECDLSWLLGWISGPVELVNKNETICSSASLTSLRNKPLIDFDSHKLCSPNIALICLTSLAIICLIVIVVLVYHNRWQLRYKLFLLKLAALGYNEMQDARDHNDYEFDVNIIFYEDDEGWIREHLRPALEEKLPQFQRIVCGDKDLIWGMHYLDAVDYVVTRSYKTIIVLSRVAVRDRWFMLKFRTAMDHVSDTQTEFVAVIFLEDIPDEEIPFLARLYLSDGRPYVYWTEDVRGQEYFFHELTKYLTINLKTNDLIPNE